MIRRLIIHYAALIAAISITAAPSQAQACEAKYEFDPYPAMTLDYYVIGYTGGTSYTALDVAAVEPVPIGVHASDIDRIILECDDLCREIDYTVPYDADWSVSVPGPEKPGSLLTVAAQEVLGLSSQTHVLYLPPSDLALGQSRTCTITATVFDDCGEADDPDITVTFTATVFRRLNGHFDVSVVHAQTVEPSLQAMVCTLVTQVCTFSGVFVIPYPPPTVSITSYPNPGMVLGEIRPIDCLPRDYDTTGFECGTPPKYPPPVISNYVDTLICDDVTYQWSVLPVPGETGNGFFLNQDRTALFRATATGNITVQVQITTNDFESTTAVCHFVIAPMRLDSLTFGEANPGERQPVARDRNATTYDTPHWRDTNADGDATDVDIDRRFPVAYSMGNTVVVDELMIDCTFKPMPGSKFLGSGPDNDVFWGAGAALLPGQAAKMLRGAAMKSTDALPLNVKKYDSYSIFWLVDFGGGHWTLLAPTDNWLYVTRPPFIGPLPGLPYPPYESVYDISCIAADGKSTDFDCAVAIWAKFATRFVTRKSRDGDNRTDGVWLKYWMPNIPGLPQRISMMMRHPDGNGSCIAWSQLLRACLLTHGMVSGVYEILPPVPPGGTGLLVQNWKVSNGNFICVGANGISESARMGDDVLEIPNGQGAPWSYAIRSGGGAFVAGTTRLGDDVIIGNTPSSPVSVILTGPDGICNSAAVAPDIHWIAQGNGLGHTAAAGQPQGGLHLAAISPGADGVLQSVPGGDDEVIAVVPGGVGGVLRLGIEIVNALGVPAQGNPEPPPIFDNHFIVEYGAFVADPSYGNLWISEAQLDDGSFAGFKTTPGNAILNPAGLNVTFTYYPAL